MSERTCADIARRSAHLAEALRTRPQNYTLHLGNSSAVRAAQQVMLSGNVPVFCNRGVNGIEGSLSAAVGYASVCGDCTLWSSAI